MIEPVEKNITVPCDPQTAFDTFVRRLSDWWPGEHSVSAMNNSQPRKVVLEPKIGGRLYEIADDGREIEWGSVKLLEEGQRIVLNWHINAPASDATEVDVTFTAGEDGKTDVTLIHRNFDVLENGADMRESYNGGWVNVFENHYGKAAEATA